MFMKAALKKSAAKSTNRLTMKILTIFTGGTIGSARRGAPESGVISPDSACSYALLNMYSSSHGDVEFETACPYTILSENLRAENLNSLCDCISARDLSAFDGVIVTHGTDTLQYTSSFLGFAFADSKTPVVLVSANYPLEDKRSNGFANFTAAVDFIRSKEGVGVFAAYKNNGENPRIHRAQRLLAFDAYSDRLKSVFGEYYGEIIDGKFVKNTAYSEDENTFAPALPIRLCEPSGIIFIRPYVSMTFPKLSRDTKAVLLEGWHSGTLPTDDDSFVQFCKCAESIKIPVYLTGAQSGFFYESKLKFDELNIRVLPPVSPIAAYMRLWLEISQNNPV